MKLKFFMYSLLSVFVSFQASAGEMNQTSSDKALLALIAESNTHKPPGNLFLSDKPEAPATIPTKSENQQRCVYNNQPYVLGDIVKTAQGWIRCTQTFFYDAENPTSLQAGSAAWVKVQ